MPWEIISPIRLQDDKTFDSLEEHALVMEKEGVIIPLNDIGQVGGLARGVCSVRQQPQEYRDDAQHGDGPMMQMEHDCATCKVSTMFGRLQHLNIILGQRT